MKKYLSFFRMRFIHGLQYRSAALAGVITQFTWGFMEILLFRAFYEADPSAFPMEFSALSCYVWLQQAFLALYMTWFWEEDIFRSIRDGSICYELCRPLNLYSLWFTRTIAVRLSKAVLRCMPILVVTAFFPKPYGMSLPSTPVAAGCFLVSMVVGTCLVASFNMIIYIVSFFTISDTGIRMVASNLSEFLCGAVIPLPFLPDKWLSVIQFLPFASMNNAPFRIYSGDIHGSELIMVIGLQFFWLIVFLVIGKAMMHRALKQVVVQGG